MAIRMENYWNYFDCRNIWRFYFLFRSLFLLTRWPMPINIEQIIYRYSYLAERCCLCHLGYPRQRRKFEFSVSIAWVSSYRTRAARKTWTSFENNMDCEQLSGKQNVSSGCSGNFGYIYADWASSGQALMWSCAGWNGKRIEAICNAHPDTSNVYNIILIASYAFIHNGNACCDKIKAG